MKVKVALHTILGWTMLALLCTAASLVGCGVSAPPPPLAPGYANPQDEQIGSTLKALHNFYSSIRCRTLAQGYDKVADNCVSDPSVTSAMTLTPTEKTAFNTFGVALNEAQATYLNYHAGAVTEAQAQDAVNAAQAKQPAIAVTQ